MRHDGRSPADLRPISFERDFTVQAAGSGLVSFAPHRVLCTASIDEDVPRDARRGKGWVTPDIQAPRGGVRTHRTRGRQGQAVGTHAGIQRLIGRSLRSVCDMGLLGERQVGRRLRRAAGRGGTRTASICGGTSPSTPRSPAGAGREDHHPTRSPIRAPPSPWSRRRHAAPRPALRGGLPGRGRMNVVMNGGGGFIEVQGTAEGAPSAGPTRRHARSGRGRHRPHHRAAARRARRGARAP